MGLSLVLGTSLKNINWSENLRKLITTDIQDQLFYNPCIYLDKVKDNEQLYQNSFSCTHFILNIKEGDFLVLTRNIPEYNLKAGRIACVEKILYHQKVQLFFLPDAQSYTKWSQNKLKN